MIIVHNGSIAQRYRNQPCTNTNTNEEMNNNFFISNDLKMLDYPKLMAKQEPVYLIYSPTHGNHNYFDQFLK